MLPRLPPTTNVPTNSILSVQDSKLEYRSLVAGLSVTLTYTDDLIVIAAESIDSKVGVDADAGAGYLGAAGGDGVLRTDSSLLYVDGGNYVTIGVNDAAIDHDSTANYVADKHIDWTNTSANFSTSGTIGGTNVTSGIDPGHSHSGGTTDELVAIDSPATPGYIGAAAGDGILRVSSSLTYVDGGDYITLGVNEAAIDHNSTANYVANEHIDWTNTTTNFSTSGTVDGINVTSGADPGHTHTVTDELVGVDAGATPGYIGAAAGDGILRVGSSLTYVDGGDYITLGVNEAAIAHDATANYVADEHIDWTNTSANFSTSGTVDGINVTSGADPGHTHSGSGGTSFPLWETNADGWSTLQLAFSERWGRMQPQTTDYNIRSGALSSNTIKWFGAVAAGDGKIYGIPHNSTAVLEIDQSDDSLTTFGSLTGTAKWIGGVLAPNGYIYGIPFDSTTVLKIDPAGGTVSTFGALSGSAKWAGGVLANNGMIYGIPYNSTTFLKIDPSDDSVTTYGSLSGTDKWVGGVLGQNGMVYGIPNTSTTVLKINPGANTASTFGSLSGSAKWSGGVCAPNGYIYGIPFDSALILKINTYTDVATTFTGVSGSDKYYGGCLGPNGRIYCAPFLSTAILEIDPIDDTIRTFGNLSGGSKWVGAAVSDNGCVYCVPSNSTTILKIGYGYQNVDLDFCLSRHFVGL
jgi:Repeat of unknown function (DUF6923)